MEGSNAAPAASQGTSTPEGAPSQATVAPKQAPKPSEPQYHEVKVNGKMVRMTQQELLDNASMSYAANSKFDEASKIRKTVDTIIKTAKDNPIEALMNPELGLTKDQIRDAFEKWYHKEYIEPETMTAEQRKMKQLEQENSKYKEEQEKKRLADEKDAEEKLTATQREYLQGQIVEAMEASGLPKTQFYAQRMAFYMRQNLMNGWDAPINLIVKQVQNERQAMMSDLSEGATAEQLIHLMGEGVINKIRQYDLKQIRDRRNGTGLNTPASPSPTRQSGGGTGPMEGRKVTSADVNRNLRNMRLGK